VDDVYSPDLKKEAQEVFGTVDEFHPAVHYLFKETKDMYIGGTLKAISLPAHYDFTDLRCMLSKLI
jgi:sulfate adenylyltransferase